MLLVLITHAEKLVQVFLEVIFEGALRGGIQNYETSVYALFPLLFLLLSQNPKRACSQASHFESNNTNPGLNVNPGLAYL